MMSMRQWSSARDQSGGCALGPGTIAVSPTIAVLAVIGPQSQIVALDPATGKELWRHDIGGAARLSIDGGTVYVAVTGQYIPEEGD